MHRLTTEEVSDLLNLSTLIVIRQNPIKKPASLKGVRKRFAD
ncbi:hypothetical protein [Bacillus sp. V2I10]|nr:hypothetical protein [Bacillus sp. V2I10]MDQ0861852.1 hypothetical protein [Bacillus sp. V2I10]